MLGGHGSWIGSLAGLASNSFTIFQCITGTSPTADSSSDTIQLASPDASMEIEGDATLDKINFKAKPEFSISFFIEKGSGWDNLTLPLWQVFNSYGVTFTKLQATTLGGGSLTFQLDERTFASLGSAGTNLFGSNQVADSDGMTQTTFANAILDATDHLVFKTGSSAESSTVTGVVITLYGTRNAS